MGSWTCVYKHTQTHLKIISKSLKKEKETLPPQTQTLKEAQRIPGKKKQTISHHGKAAFYHVMTEGAESETFVWHCYIKVLCLQILSLQHCSDLFSLTYRLRLSTLLRRMSFYSSAFWITSTSSLVYHGMGGCFDQGQLGWNSPARESRKHHISLYSVNNTQCEQKVREEGNVIDSEEREQLQRMFLKKPSKETISEGPTQEKQCLVPHSREAAPPPTFTLSPLGLQLGDLETG